MKRNAIVLSFSLLVLPTLSLAECEDKTSASCIYAKAVETSQIKADPGTQSTSTALTAGETDSPPEATAADSRQDFSSINKKRRAERQFPRFEPADPRDTVLSSEICVYSSASYSYSCR